MVRSSDSHGAAMTRRLSILILGSALVSGMMEPAAAAYLPNGATAPNFTKPQHLTGTPRSLAEFAGKVVVLFQFGYNCPVCNNQGPAFEQEIHQYYLANEPSEVVVIGVDMYNGTDAQVTTFKNNTGASYLLLRNGGDPVGGDLDDLVTGLGPFDNYLVISKQGVIRFNTYHEYVHGSRYQRDRIRSCVDSLVGQNVGVEDPAGTRAHLAARPNPFVGDATVEFAVPRSQSPVSVTVHDLAGRRLATLWEGPAPAGVSRTTWDGRLANGAIAPAGVYLVRARIGAVERSLRLVRMR